MKLIGFLFLALVLFFISLALVSLNIVIWGNWIGGFGLNFRQVLGLAGIITGIVGASRSEIRTS